MKTKAIVLAAVLVLCAVASAQTPTTHPVRGYAPGGASSGWSGNATGAADTATYTLTTDGRIMAYSDASGATYDVQLTDHVIGVSRTATGACQVNLPSAAVAAGRVFAIHDAGGSAATNNITIATDGAELIDGAATYVVSVDYAAVAVVSDGVNWFSQWEPAPPATPAFTGDLAGNDLSDSVGGVVTVAAGNDLEVKANLEVETLLKVGSSADACLSRAVATTIDATDCSTGAAAVRLGATGTKISNYAAGYLGVDHYTTAGTGGLVLGGAGTGTRLANNAGSLEVKVEGGATFAGMGVATPVYFYEAGSANTEALATSSTFRVRSGGGFTWSSSATSAGNSPDLAVVRNAAGVIDIRDANNDRAQIRYHGFAYVSTAGTVTIGSGSTWYNVKGGTIAWTAGDTATTQQNGVTWDATDIEYLAGTYADGAWECHWNITGEGTASNTYMATIMEDTGADGDPSTATVTAFAQCEADRTMGASVVTGSFGTNCYIPMVATRSYYLVIQNTTGGNNFTVSHAQWNCTQL